MSRLARTLALAAMLAAMTLAGLTAVAQAQPTQDDTVKRAAEAQERYYSTWSYGDTPAPVVDEPSGQPGWLVPAIGVLAAALVLLGVLAATIVRRARGRVRVRQVA
jgi:hypothetical protein